MVLQTSAVYSQCNMDNWEHYYPDRMQDCNLAGADLKGADFEWAFLKSANLSGSNLKGLNLSGAYLQMADLTGANLTGANLENADLSRANLKGVDLKGSICYGTNFSGADLKGANFKRVFLKSANLHGANLKEANLKGVISGKIKGVPKSLPDGWSLVGGVLVNKSEGIKDESKDVENDALSLFDNIDNNGNKKISKKEWKLYIDEQQPKFIKDKTIFSSIDKNKNKKISKKEFITFFKRLMK